MNHYSVWKILAMIIAVVVGIFYTLPNFFGEVPAVQISSAKATIKVTPDLVSTVENLLQRQNIPFDAVFYEVHGQTASVRVRLKDFDAQLHAKDLLQRSLNTESGNLSDNSRYTVALNILPASPHWFARLSALPMYLGLDLRGGVHFLLQVDMESVLIKQQAAAISDVYKFFAAEKIQDYTLEKVKHDGFTIQFASAQAAENARRLLEKKLGEFNYQMQQQQLSAQFNASIYQEIQKNALQQNITTLYNRINELGVSEPIIQQQGTNRIVVQLPGVQDTAKAKEIIGRTATLEARLVDANAPRVITSTTIVAPGSELFTLGRGAPVILKRQVLFTGDRITHANAGFDQYQRPAVNIRLDSQTGDLMRSITRANLNKPMAIVLFEKGQGEVLTVANIISEFSQNFEITGVGSAEAANDLALLLRAGSLAAPMEIIEERTIGPSLGADNIQKGFRSVTYGFIAIALFMMAYYLLFGLFSVSALSVNLLLLVAALSLLQATLTLPGIAAIALTLGMAIDANVLINERIREELRNNLPPQKAIAEGFSHAWRTILDSNITTLIAGLALLAFGSGPIRGFAIVHCIGILTSMFSAVFFSRGLVNLWYGGRHRLQSLSIGQVWRPKTEES